MNNYRKLTDSIPLPAGLNEDNFGAMLRTARTMYDYILIDSPAGLGAGFQLSIAHADRAIVVATNDATSLRDAQRVVGELGHIKRVHLVMNRIQPQLLRKMRTTIDDAMIGVVPEDVEVMLCTNRGEPITNRGRKGAGQACWNIAQRLDGLCVPIMRIRKQGLF